MHSTHSSRDRLDSAECQSRADAAQQFEYDGDAASVRNHIPSYFAPKDTVSFVHLKAEIDNDKTSLLISSLEFIQKEGIILSFFYKQLMTLKSENYSLDQY